MRHARRSFVHLALAGAALFLSSLAVCAAAPATDDSSPAAKATSKAAAKWAGTYDSEMPKPGAPPGGSMSVSLGVDGTATVSQDPGKGSTTLFGHWTDNGSQITITFDAAAGQPAAPPMTFAPGHDGLQAVTWDHAAWGKLTPPPMKKGDANWHKPKHSWL
jgi:hypothetical protein